MCPTIICLKIVIDGVPLLLKKFATKSANKVILWKLIESLEVVVLPENLSLNFDNSNIAWSFFFFAKSLHLWVIPLKDIPKEKRFLPLLLQSNVFTICQLQNCNVQVTVCYIHRQNIFSKYCKVGN